MENHTVKWFGLIIITLVLISTVLFMTGCSPTGITPEGTTKKGPMINLRAWNTPDRRQGGIVLESQTNKDMFMYLWFYEWNMFEAVRPGEHTFGFAGWTWEVNSDKSLAIMMSPALSMVAKTVDDGAELTLTITNTSGYDWSEQAAIIPCFNPGLQKAKVTENPMFLDITHTNTYFLGHDGLDLLKEREIHFNNELRPVLDEISPDGRFVFSRKWPTSPKNATAGLIIRQAKNGKWVTAIAWEDFLSAQGHNPWKCMHLAISVGPLKNGESKKIRGKIYLFQGNKENCLNRFYQDFPLTNK
ncbi:MAG: hypothetical protein ACYS9Y_14795 [Planctomycetota bacterium]|jgi:hypothetical protein